MIMGYELIKTVGILFLLNFRWICNVTKMIKVYMLKFSFSLVSLW